jgi:VWFA-related protein
MSRLCMMALAAATLAAQEVPPPSPFRATVNIVVAPTAVIDHDGSFVSGLQPQDFRLYDNKKLQDIKVDVSYIPISLVVAVQCSAGVETLLPKIQRIGPLLQNLVAGEQGEVAILAFDSRLRLLQDFTSDGQKINAAMHKITAGSYSGRVVDAVNESVHLLRRRPADRRRIILLISETRDNGSEGKVRETMTEAQINNVLAYTVNMNRLVTTLTAKGLPPRSDPFPATARHMPAGGDATPTTAAQNNGADMYGNYIPVFVEIFKQVKAIFVSNPAEVLTKFTGGHEFAFSSEKALEHALARIADELHSQYIISYTPNNKIEGGWHDIHVEVSRPDVAIKTIRTRPGYWMAGVPE